MKTIRKHIKFYSLLFASAILFYSFKDIDVVVKKAEMNEQSGKDIFKSVYFGLGETANQLSIYSSLKTTYNNLDPKVKTQTLTLIDKLISEVEKKDPNFFNDFKSKIISGNHVTIDEAINSGGIKIYENISTIFPNFKLLEEKITKDITEDKVNFNQVEDVEKYVSEFNESKYDDILDNNMNYETQACSIFLGCAVVIGLYFVAAVHNTVAVVANVYLYFALWGPKLDSPKKKSISHAKESSLLKKEMLVDQLANVRW